jgi:hypothetical protein
VDQPITDDIGLDNISEELQQWLLASALVHHPATHLGLYAKGRSRPSSRRAKVRMLVCGPRLLKTI